MKSYKTDGIILKRSNLKEADRLLTVLTSDKGKIKLIARGIRKITSKKAPHLEPFSLISIFVVKGKNLDMITEVETVNSYVQIRSNLSKIGHAYQMCELIDKLCPEEQINRSLFELLKIELGFLNNSERIPENLEHFSHKVLWDLGYLPKESILPKGKIDEFIDQLAERKIHSRGLLAKIIDLNK